METLIGQQVLLICLNYFYAGKLVEVGDHHVRLEDALLVYETGEWDAKSWKDAQKLPGTSWSVRRSAIESFGVVSKA